MASLKNYIDDFKKIVDCAVNISMSVRGTEASGRIQEEASGFLMKNAVSGYTLLQIVEPKADLLPSLSKGGILYDTSTPNVIVRSMFEAYINMYYLVIDAKDEACREFRFDLWDLHALCERQLLGKSISSIDKKLDVEKNQIQRLLKKLLESEYLSNLPKPQQQSIRDSLEGWNKHGRTPRWTETNLNTYQKANIAGFHNSTAEYLYKYTSAYAHSESYAIMQLLYINSLEEINQLFKVPIIYAEMCLVLTLEIMMEIDFKSKILITANKLVLEKIDFWKRVKPIDVSKIIADF